jgi:hypothetical protein
MLISFGICASAAASLAAVPVRRTRRGPPAPLGRGRTDVAMLRLSVCSVDRLPINRPVGVGKPWHVVGAIAHPRVIREAENGRRPADGATVNDFARSLRLGITDLVSHRDLCLDDTRHVK